MKTIIFTTSTGPSSDAGAIRVTTIAKALILSGHNVLIVLMNNFKNYQIHNYDGIDYVSLKSRFRNYKQSVKELLKSLNISWDNFLIYSAPLHAFLFLKSYGIKNNIKLFHDSVEWYSLMQFGPFSFAYYEKDFINRFVIDRHFKVIAISKYLENYYSGKGIPVVRVPVILDVQSVCFDKRTPKDKLVILYAGSPAKKDKLDILIKGLLLLSDDELNKVELNIIGITHEQLKKIVPVDLKRVKKSIKVFGRISRKEVLEQLSRAHFTVLFRHSRLRYAKAGFPTKFVESLATATPVILNLSSDLADYVVDKENGIVIEDYSPGGINKGLKYALNLSQEDLTKMQTKARITAETYFNYIKYIERLSFLIN